MVTHLSMEMLEENLGKWFWTIKNILLILYIDDDRCLYSYIYI